ncbi:MAG: DNA translocase FtsK 4TM domain-containing protein [Alphaproteobacteria bacterium]
MALASSGADRKKLLPSSVETGLKRLAWWCAGATLIIMALAAWASLATWSIHDPSLNHATRVAPANLLAYWGAVTADLSIQSLGLAAIFLFLPLAAWGWHISFGEFPARAKLRLAAWPLGVILIAGGLSSLPEPDAWPLPNGFGGIMGDLALAFIRMILAPLPEFLLRGIAALAFLAAGGAAMFFASGITSQIVTTLRGERQSRSSSTEFIIFGALDRIGGALRSLFAGARSKASNEEAPYAPMDDDGYEYSETDYDLNADPELDDSLPKFLRRERQAASADASGRIEPFFANASTPTLTPAEVNGESASENEEDAYTITRNGEEAPVRMKTHSAPTQLEMLSDFSLPPTRLLKKAPAARRVPGISDKMLQQNARLLEEVLQDFGVKGEITNVSPGPVVTLYELEPAPGTKSSRVIGLADDIARSMSAVSTRVAVVPGRNAIGIELPNMRRQMVFLRELLEAGEARESEAKLMLALGKNIGGDPICVDLARMPHLLIAGTTGSGKSVGINTMILSLLYRLDPNQCKFIMIDPKMLELSVYDGIPHLLAPVVTDPKKAVVALKWTVKEMEERYKRMSKLGVRNINGYNERVAEALERDEVLTRTVQTGFDKETGEAIFEQEEMNYEPMPYIVVIVDEMADLMMVAGKDIEGAVQRLAQMARAAGIHLITATQRPSVDVITGTIKANFPTRISFQVTSKIDSRTILGEQGAEQLLGQGDMLYMAGGGRIMRIHAPFVSDDEVEKVVRYLKKQGVPEYLEAVTAEDEEGGGEYGEAAGNGSSGDAIYDQAVAVVLRDRKASTSYVQRRLSIGYNRAATLIERMEEEGVISSANNAGKREILVGENV